MNKKSTIKDWITLPFVLIKFFIESAFIILAGLMVPVLILVGIVFLVKHIWFAV